MSEHSSFSLLDLVSDITFRQWVVNGCPPDEDIFWVGWQRENVHQQELVKKAVAVLRATHHDEYVADYELEEIASGTWERIAEMQAKPARKLHPFWWAAASVSVLIAAWVLVENRLSSLPFLATGPKTANRIVPETWTENTNTGKLPKLISLSDSSSVLLLPGSTLRYPVAFEPDMREVQLSGAAFFEIVKQKSHPFLIQANGLITKVTGTSFSIRAYESEENVKVVVKTGHVTVYSDYQDYKKINVDSVSLSPAQRAIFDKNLTQITKSAADPLSDMLPIEHTSFEFVDVPVATILDSLAHTYGLQIEYDKKKLSRCALTTTLKDLPLQKKLKIICKALGDNVSYELTENRVRIKGFTACSE